MAGGLFGQPFAFNEKCIVFSLLCMSLFLYKPSFPNNYWLYFTLFIIFVISYVAMAWYDYYFNCDLVRLKKGTIGGITQMFKPDTEETEETSKEFDMRHVLIYMSHLIFIVPLLIYIAIYKQKINPIVYPILGILAVFTAGYHGAAMMLNSH